MRLFSRVVAIVAIFGGAISAASCASFGASSEPTPTAPADSGPAAAEGGTEDGSIGDGGAPPDAPPGTPLQCPTNAILCDAFEDRGSPTNLAGTKWGALTGLATGRIDDAMWFSPAHSLAIDVPMGTSGKTLGLEAKPQIKGTGVSLRAAIRLSALPPYAQLISMVVDNWFFAVIVNNGKLIAQYRNGADLYPYAPVTTDAPLDRWFNVTLELRFGPAGRVRFAVDNVLLDDIPAETTAATTVSSFILVVDPDFGGTSVTATKERLTIHYDDIVLE